MDASRPKVALLAALAILLSAAPAVAHIGSPNVYYEGNAGPYHLFVTVNAPKVIPGVAEIRIRSDSDDVTAMTTTVARLTGAGSKYVPTPDSAVRDANDPRTFISNLWLMEYGSLRVLIQVTGKRGKAQISVPVPSFASAVLPMPKWLGAILLILAIGLALGAVSIVGAAAGQSTLAPGAADTGPSRRRRYIAMGASAVVVGLVFYGAFAWWNTDADAFARNVQYFRAPKMDVVLKQDELTIDLSDKIWNRYQNVDQLLPDHGHLMHLFLIETPGLNRMWHLHPSLSPSGQFHDELPPIVAGNYKVFADVVDQYGFPWTFVATEDLPAVSGAAMRGDDSSVSTDAIGSQMSATDKLADGTEVTWERGDRPIRVNQPLLMRVAVKDPGGAPATDLQPYMGMSAHAEIVRSDFSVFAHIHPSGSVPMESLELANADTPGMGGIRMADMPGMAMPDQKIAPEITIPYGFPKPGLYRIFFQFKRADTIETAVFDTTVE